MKCPTDLEPSHPKKDRTQLPAGDEEGRWGVRTGLEEVQPARCSRSEQAFPIVRVHCQAQHPRCRESLGGQRLP